MILILILLSAGHAAAFNTQDIEWGTEVTGTLYEKGTLTNGQYMVKAVQFSSGVPGVKDVKGNIVPETNVDPMVILEVYKNGSLLKQVIMTMKSDTYIDTDYEVKVTVTGFLARDAKEWVLEFYKPWASVSIQIRAVPELEVTVTTGKTTYISYSDTFIVALVAFKNNDARMYNVDINLNTGGLRLIGGQLHQTYYKIEKDSNTTFDVELIVPETFDSKTYTLSADVKGYDVKDIEYRATVSTLIVVSPRKDLILSKALKDRIYLQDTEIVRITAANGGVVDIADIHITDNLSEKFELISDTPLQWDIPLLKPGQEWSTEYKIRPLEANAAGFVVPAASARFMAHNEPSSVSSNTTTVVVNGPKIILTKIVNKSTVNLSEDVTVTVNINNAGNIATRAEIRDSLPEGIDLINGSTSLLSTYMELNVPQSFSYVIRMNREGTIELPAAIANYTGIEYKGTTRSVKSSDKPVITVINQSKNASNASLNASETSVGGPGESKPGEAKNTQPQISTSRPTSTPIIPGFDIAPVISVLILVAVYSRKCKLL